MSKLIEIEGIGPSYAEKLNAIGLKTTDDLLEKGSTPKERHALEQATGISGKQLLRWINMADLFRIKGVGEQYSDLLEAAGVDTVVELGQRKPENLHARLVAVNEEKNLVRQVPSAKQVEGWVEHAKTLERKVHY